MAQGRAVRALELSGDEREALERWARRHTSAQALATRCRIVLACAEGGDNGEVASRLGLHRETVRKWRNRFIERRLDGLHDEPRPGKPRTITDDDVERVIVKTLESTPPNATHWSTRSMAASTGLSQTAVSRIWRAFGLKPHKVEDFKLSPDPLFIDKVRDVDAIDRERPRGTPDTGQPCVPRRCGSSLSKGDAAASAAPWPPSTPTCSRRSPR